MSDVDPTAIDAERERIRQTYLQLEETRRPSSARGLHHLAVVARAVEETVAFYQGVLEFPLTEIFENRDYKGSNHFFFDTATATCWRTSTSPASTSVRTRRCSAGCTTSPSRSSRRRGSG